MIFWTLKEILEDYSPRKSQPQSLNGSWNKAASVFKVFEWSQKIFWNICFFLFRIVQFVKITCFERFLRGRPFPLCNVLDFEIFRSKNEILDFGLIRSREAPPSKVVDEIKLVRPIFGLPNPARWLDLYLAAKPSYPKLVSLYLVCQIQLGEHHTKTILVWTYLEYWRVKD